MSFGICVFSENRIVLNLCIEPVKKNFTIIQKLGGFIFNTFHGIMKIRIRHIIKRFCHNSKFYPLYEI